MSAIDDLPPLSDVIRRFELSARKSLGQNFLLDLNLTSRIARAAAPLEDATIVEIGPGPGGLTRALLAQGVKRVIAVERDERAIPALEEIEQRYPGRLTIVNDDAMTFDPRPLLDGKRARIVANLPYNIATVLLIDWLCAEPWPPWYDMMVLMFQREVAERIVARENDEAYGRLGVLAHWRAKPKSCSIFCRAPSRRRLVTSSVVRLILVRRQNPLIGARWSAWHPPLSGSAARCCGKVQNRWRRSGVARRCRRRRPDPPSRDYSLVRLCCHGPGIGGYNSRKSKTP